MYTRFNDDKYWLGAGNKKVVIKRMETSHLLNIVNMFVTRPTLTLSMIIADIEKYKSSWTWPPETPVVSESLRNATSMSFEEIVKYSLTCELGVAILSELEVRGVNTQNYINQIRG